MEEEHHHYGGVTTTNNTPSAMTDLRHFFSPIPTPGHHLFSAAYAGPPLPHHYENMMLLHDFRSDNSAAAIMPNTSSAAGFEIDNATGASGLGFGVDGGATARWPRQETLTLLEIRSRLDHKFKEANHKGPLWDEVSRIMCEEHGYQRSGKKCREKFENLYKYYKKTKEGKAGRQDGKHYRFFRQLEALYGESTQHQHQHQHHHPIPISDHPHLNMISSATGVEFHGQEGFQSMSLSNTSSDFDTSSSVDVNGDSSPIGRSRKRRGSWKAKIKEFVDSQMRRIMEKQEAWLEKMMKTLENKEKERMLREEEWRKQETLRMDKEHKLWAKERAWIEARDKALMDALQRLTGKENDHKSPEMIKLLELRGSMQARFDHCNGGSESEEGDEIWKEISGRMACLGHDTTPKMCKEKWDFMSKKRKENSSSSRSHQYDYGEMNCALAPTQTRLREVNSMTDSCFRILLGDEGGTTPWDHTYGVKLNKERQLMSSSTEKTSRCLIFKQQTEHLYTSWFYSELRIH